MSILILEQHSEWVSIGDVPSHPTLVGTCFTFISFNIAAIGLGYLEMCPPTPSYVGTCYFISNQHHGCGSSTNPHFIEVHLLGRTLLVSQLVTSITGYLYPRIFVLHGYGSSTNPQFIEVHLLGHTLSESQLVTSITGYLYPRIFIYQGFGLTT